MKPPKRPRDPNQLAKMIVDLSTGQLSENPIEHVSEPPLRVGRAGGLKGGRARAVALTPDQRSQIAAVAAQARWKKD